MVTVGGDESGEVAGVVQINVQIPDGKRAKPTITGMAPLTPVGHWDVDLDDSRNLAALVSPTVTIGGQNAAVQFAGNAPGEVAGVVHINVQIPTGVALRRGGP